MKLNKVAFAVASALAIAAGSAYAGQIDSSSATLAIEAIKNNAQIVRAPSKSYSFAGNINAQTNEQRLQLQYTLSKGTWAVGGTAPIFTALDTIAPLLADQLLKVNYNDGANAGQTTLPPNSTVEGFVTAAGKTLVLNITIPAVNDAVHVLNNPVFVLNADGFVVGRKNNAGITNLFDVAGATACVAPDSNVDINFKHFSNHFGNTTVLSAASPDSEHQRGGATNDARLLNFTQNLEFKFTPASATSRTDAAFLNQRLAAPTNFGAAVPPGIVLGAKQTRHYIGSVKLNVRSNGLDLNYVNTYGKAAGAAYALGDFDAADDTGTLDNGKIEAKDLTIKLTSPVAWPTGTVVHMVDALGAAVAGVPAVTTTAGQTDFVFKATAAADMAVMANGAFLFADFPGDALIPQTTSLAATATLTKDTLAGATDLREQDNMCASTLTGIGGGIKIDVRNYATHATFGNNGPATTVRIINNSESTPADVYGQLIYADGTYGAWGKLADLKPREVVNMSNKDVEALLVNAPAATNPFGASTAYTVTSGTAIKGSTKAGISDRLRIVSNSGSTLRVQSYMVVGNTVIDTSNAQGVDFENSGDRVPVTAVDAQPVSQDAINGLSK